MPAGNTYTQIASTTLGSAAASVTFSSIAGTYTDLVLLSAASNLGVNGNGLAIQFNTDTATNYSKTYWYGDGTSVASGRNTTQSNISISNMPISSTGVFAATVTNIQNYSNATA
jgi:hypothetical protein